MFRLFKSINSLCDISMLSQYDELRAARGKTLATEQHEITQDEIDNDISMISGI